MPISQKFAVATHVLIHLAAMDADHADRSVSSRVLAQCLPTGAVVVRRATAALGRSGMIAARAGAHGGSWLARPPAAITLDAVLKALDGRLGLGAASKAVGQDSVLRALPAAIDAAIAAADEAVRERLASVSIQDLLERVRTSV